MWGCPVCARDTGNPKRIKGTRDTRGNEFWGLQDTEGTGSNGVMGVIDNKMTF